MPYFYSEDEVEGFEPVDAVPREDYDAIITERDEIQSQRDEAITRAEDVETELSKLRDKYASTFLSTPNSAKANQKADVIKDGKRLQRHSNNYSERKVNTVPTKPSQDIINASKNKLDPHAVMEAVINETPELARMLVDKGLARELTDEEVAAMSAAE